MRDYTFLEQFLNDRVNDAAPTVMAFYHNNIMQQSIELLHTKFKFPHEDVSILDVGCGLGEAREMFLKLYPKMQYIGTCLNDADLDKCKDSLIMDQNFMPSFWSNKFDIIYARHILEHSIMPYFTLTEYARILKPAGVLYIEVPICREDHLMNPNHYSLLTKDAWKELINRAKLKLEIEVDIRVSATGELNRFDGYLDFYKESKNLKPDDLVRVHDFDESYMFYLMKNERL